MRLIDVLKKLKIGVPRRILFFSAAVVWGFASSRILKIGFNDIISHTSSYWVNFVVGVIGCYFFFKYVFYKMYKKYTKRIVNLKIENPCIFSFFDLRGFIIMLFMITAGLTLRRAHIIPLLYMGTFYITLGFSLLLSSLSFLYSGFRYNIIESKYLNHFRLDMETK